METGRKTACLFWMEAILFLTGLRLNPTQSVTIKLINYGFLFLALLRTTVASYEDMKVIVMKGFTVYKFADIAYWFFVWIWFLSMIKKQREHRNFFKQTMHLLPREELDCLNRESRVSALRVAGYFLVIILCVLPILSPNRTWILNRIFVYSPKRSVTQITLANIAHAYEAYVAALWMPTCMTLYSMAHLIKHRLRIQSLKLIFHLRGHQSGINIMHRMSEVDRQFTSAFSIYPYLILAAIFFQTAGYLLNQLDSSSGQQNPIDRIQLIVLSVTYLTVLIVLVSIVTSRRTELSKLKYKLIDHLQQQENKRHVDVILIETILRSMGKETAWNMFPIDWSLVSAYLGYLLSFSVLFHQLLPHAKRI